MNLILAEEEVSFVFEAASNGVVRSVRIVFRDGVFKECLFGLVGPYSREDWKFLVAVEKKITALEKARKGKRK